jgi:IS5 family transposase
MAYQVLARKYRPQRFTDVVGQDHVTVTLMNALNQDRIAHGYIFSGHRGIGKTTIARILAMALNCRNPIGSELRPTAEPCEVCDSCTEIKAGNAVDVIEIDAATNRGIDEIRELRDAARYRPARDRYPEMHQTRKGNQWYFGLKAHIGVDSKQGVVHSVCTSAASVADKHMLPDLLHGEERKVWGDGGYQGQTEAIREAAPHAQDMTCRRTKFKNYVDEEARRKNTTN